MKDQFRTFPRRDTFTARKKIVKRVRHAIRAINKTMMEKYDNRFWMEIISQEIRPLPDHSGWVDNFIIEFHDEDNPERFYMGKFNSNGILESGLYNKGRYLDTEFGEFVKLDYPATADWWVPMQNG